MQTGGGGECWGQLRPEALLLLVQCRLCTMWPVCCMLGAGQPSCSTCQGTRKAMLAGAPAGSSAELIDFVSVCVHDWERNGWGTAAIADPFDNISCSQSFGAKCRQIDQRS
jgi:hypothetical protein